jgi:hypothetical protein
VTAKKETSKMMNEEPSGFAENIRLEGRLKLRDSDPAKYLRETSPALRLTVDRYAELRAEHERAVSGLPPKKRSRRLSWSCGRRRGG